MRSRLPDLVPFGVSKGLRMSQISSGAKWPVRQEHPNEREIAFGRSSNNAKRMKDSHSTIMLLFHLDG